MKTIHRLSDRLIAQIAAGEIIERPVYVVKELIDNAIDAQADDIRIDLTEHGFQYIIVTDNGRGMSEEDIIESYKLHTTSKVDDIDVLIGITSLGFRGEALASIAAVSSLSIESKQQDSVSGKKIILERGTPPVIQTVGMPNGTRVIVSGLFKDMPVRKKFTATKKQELKRIIDIVTAYAMSHPFISFDLSHEGKALINVRKGDREKRITYFYGNTVLSHLLPLHYQDRFVTIQGFISTPQLSSSLIPFQYLSVNGRPAIEKSLHSSIKHTYGILLESERQPSYILDIGIEPSLVDVNIHPRKEYVAIIDIQHILPGFTELITSRLKQTVISYQGLPQTIHDEEKLTYTPLAKQLKRFVLPKKEYQLSQLRKNDHVIQIHTTYIAYETDSGFILIDQHAAHERILYEEYLHVFLEEKKKQRQEHHHKNLIIELSHQEYILWELYKEDLSTLGFITEEYHSNAIIVRSYPSLFSGRNMNVLLKEILQDMETNSLDSHIDNGSKKLLAYLACRSAIKAGDPLTKDQMNTLIRNLENIPFAVTCPHGRPVKYTISLNELHKMFKRI